MTKYALAAVAFVVAVIASGTDARADAPIVQDRVMGKADAPVTIVEYASLTCSHCAEFTTKVLPEIEKKYVETGKVKYIFRMFPIDGIALKASVLAYCMPQEQFYPFINVLYKNIEQWAFGKTPEVTLIQYAKLGGLGEERAKECLQNTKLLDDVVAIRTEAQDKYDISATPTFIFNDGAERINGGLKLEAYTVVIDRLLAKAGVPTTPEPAPAPASAPAEKPAAQAAPAPESPSAPAPAVPTPKAKPVPTSKPAKK